MRSVNPVKSQVVHLLMEFNLSFCVILFFLYHRFSPFPFFFDVTCGFFVSIFCPITVFE